MKPRRNHVRSSAPEASILLLGLDSPFQRALAGELHAMACPVVRAPSISEATHDAGKFSRPPNVLLLPETSIDPERFEEELAELMVRAATPRLEPIAVGREPDDVQRAALRRAGIHLALFGRFGRHALRFQINRALSPHPAHSQRGDLRAPMEWRTRTYSGGREKTVRCYSLSTGGGYFVTPRPWVVGSDIALELPVSGERRRIEGRILYTKGTGAPERPTLPGGMAVAFRPLSQPLHDAIRRDLTHIQFGLEV